VTSHRAIVSNLQCVMCADVSSTFRAFIQLSIRERHAHVVVQLCHLYFLHPSLILWHAELLHHTITFLLSQCAGDCRSRFVATAIPLAELATTMNIYPRLAELNRPGRGMLCLWDFMSQAEIYTLLCVYLQSVRRQCGMSQPSLDFTIVGIRRPSDMQPQLPVFSGDFGEFVQRIECALVDNLQLSPAVEFQRVGTSEWRVTIADITRITDTLPVSSSSVYKPAASADRRRPSAAESRDCSSVSGSSDGWATPKRKVLLATPSATQRSDIVLHPVPPTTTSVSGIPSSVLLTDCRAARGAVPVLPVSPHVQLQSSAVRSDRHGLVISQSSEASHPPPIEDFIMPPPQQNSSLPTSDAYHNVLYPNRQRSVPLQVHAAQQNLTSAAAPVDFDGRYASMHGASGAVMSRPAVMPSNVSGMVPVGPSSQSVSVTSPMFAHYNNAAPLPVTLASFTPIQYTSSSQQPSLEPWTTWTSPPAVAGPRMTTAGRFSYIITFIVSSCQYYPSLAW